MLVHLDAYRLDDYGKSRRSCSTISLSRELRGALAVEWPEKIAAWLPDNALHLALGIADDGRHTIRLR